VQLTSEDNHDQRASSAGGEDFGSMFERSLRAVKPGEVVTGRVVHLGRDHVTVDIGYKSEGQIPIHEFRNRDGSLDVQEGEEIDVYFESSESEDGGIVLSRQKAEQFRVWRDIEKAYEKEGAVEGTIVGKVKGGLKVDIGVPAFLPGSHAISGRRATSIASSASARVSRDPGLNRSRGNAVVPRRASWSASESLAGETLWSSREGVILEGTVKNT
jgi:small subunit ribosomal protein S1